MSRVVLGDLEITPVRAGFYWWDGGAMFSVVPKTLWSRKFEPDDLNRVRLGFNCYVIRTGEHSILIETGPGDKLDRKARERMKLPEREPALPQILASRDIDPESIDIVINTHLHFDIAAGTRRSRMAARSRRFRARDITPGAANGSTRMRGTSATASAISMRTTIRWSSRGRCNWSMAIAKLRLASK